MNKPPSRSHRWPWIFLGVVIGGAVFVGLSLFPPVQGWLLRRIIAKQPGWKLDFERIGVGPRGLDASGLKFAMPGIAATSAPIAIRVVPTRLLSKRELRLERVEAQKIRVVLTPAELAPTPAGERPPAPFDGVLRLLQAPLPWALDTANLDGEIVVRDAGQSRVTGNFSLHGGGLSTATPGDFAYELIANSLILPRGPDNKFASKGTVRITQNATHGIASIEIQGDLLLPRYGKLILPQGHVTLDITATSTGENYVAQISLGDAFRLDLDAALDASASKLLGHATIHANQTAGASLPGDRLPRVVGGGSLTFAFDFRSGDLEAKIDGDLDAGDWQKLMPQLAALGDFQGRLTAAVKRRADKLTLDSFNARLASKQSTATASLTIEHPLDLQKIPDGPLGNVSLAHWPLAWANPFLQSQGVELAPGEFSAAWTIGLNGSKEIRLLPTQPARLDPIKLLGEKASKLPSWTIFVLPTLEASADKMKLTLDDLSAVSSQGDRIESRLEISIETDTGAIHTSGHVHAALPTLFATRKNDAPVNLSSNWDLTLKSNQLHVAAVSFDARDLSLPSPAVAVELVRPFDFDLETHAIGSIAGRRAIPAALPTDNSDLLRLRFDHLPMAWFSQVLSGPLSGSSVVAGESIFRASAKGGFELHTRTPWRFASIPLNPETSVIAQFSPEASLDGDDLRIASEDIRLNDQKGNGIAGEIDAAVKLGARNFQIAIALDADLPSLPHSAETFGALRGTLRAKFHDVTPRIVGADELELKVKNASGELLSLTSPSPFIFGLSNNDMTVVSTLAPLRLKTAALPLSWLNPWSKNLILSGNVDPMELMLSSKNDAYFLRSARLVSVEHFSAKQSGRELMHEATITFDPGVDLTFICTTKPVLDFAYVGTAHFTNAKLEVARGRAVDLDLALAFKGNDKLLIPDQVDLSSRIDFSVLSGSGVTGLPPAGVLVTRANGDLLGGKPVELWGRLTGVPAKESGESLPPLEATLKGKFSRENILTGGVTVLLATTPTATDANFSISFNLLGGALDITSGLHSHFLDGAALLAYARAFPTTPAQPKPVASDKTPGASAKEESAAYATLPFWGELTGSFDLDIGAFQFAPYRIDQMRGRLDVSKSKVSLHDLGGKMFAGRWGGNVEIEHPSDNTTGEHTLNGEFRIEQFESARVVQTVFPHQLSTIDARINVHAKVASHGNSFVSLVDRSTADFSVDGANGIIRLTVPKADLMSTAAVFGGTVLLSPELRALGRLLKKFAEMPVEQLSITGRKAAGGEVTLDEFRFDSPQVRIAGHGRILADHAEPLMNHPLRLSLTLQARDELAVILGGMSLLDKKPLPDGFRAMHEPFVLGGRAGAPDTAPLYDLLAKGVSGSKGTWGFLMRKVQAEISREKPAPDSHSP